MTSTYPAKNVASSIGLMRPILLASLALHGLLLLIPMGENQKDKSLQVQDEEIKVTQLPAAPRNPIAVSSTPPSKATPGTTKLPTLPPKVGTLGTVLPNTRSNARPAATGQTTTTATTGNTSTQPATQTTAAATTTPLPTTSQTLPSLTNSTNTTPPTQTTSTETTPPKFITGVAARNPNPQVVLEFNETLKRLRSDFPNYPGARLGCMGLPSCYMAQADITRINNFLGQGLQSKGFELTSETDEPDRKVYRVSRDGKDHILTILSDGLYTVYLLSDGPRSFADIQTAQQHFAAYTNVLNRLTAISTAPRPSHLVATPADFIKPELFYKSVASPDTASATTPGETSSPELEVNRSTDGNVRLIKNQTPAQVFSSLEPELLTAGFQIEDMKARYGGGPLYQVTKENVRLFLNLVPTKDGQGTILVTWFGSPTRGMAFRHQHYFVISDRL